MPPRAAACVIALAFAGGCAIKKPPAKHYYDQHIQPIFNNFCSSNTSPCHSIDKETGSALGNLDLSSFEGVHRRPDVLRAYGSYPLPLLLLKAVPESSVVFPYRGAELRSEIRHAGGKTIAYGSDAFFELQGWLRNGANRDGVAVEPKANQGEGTCNTEVPADRDVSTVDTSSASYQMFVTGIATRLSTSCAYATCHSSPQSDFYITCGATEQQMRFNYQQAAGFIVSAPTPVEQSEILLRPLAAEAGGVSHTGGTFIFSRNPDDAVWTEWRNWGAAVQAERAAAPAPPALSAGQKFFEDRVMPKMLQRGCALEGCHSPAGFNDFRLRSGAQGFFAPRAMQRNYDATLKEFMALDTVDVRQSRVVKKTTFARFGGIAHRAGAVLEDEEGVDGGTPVDTARACPATFDPSTATAFCTFAEWHRLERVDHAAVVSPMTSGSKVPLAFVARPPDGDSLLAFDTFRGGADLMLADATLGAQGAVTGVANARSVLGGCAGLAAGSADVRGPEWSADGQKLVFAGRPSAAGGLDLWLLEFGATGVPSGCRQLTSDNGRMQGAVKVHNFDPVFAPDGSIVFSSTRAGTLTPKLFLPNADLYRSRPAADFTSVEQMTWLLASEIGAAFMQDGRVSFTAEKATPDFYQLAGRRINWDLTDYHPLLAQRARSTDTFTDAESDSVGFTQATEIREALDRNFLLILSNVGAQGGGGALATFNRSVGPFERGRGEASFLRSMQIVDPAATGEAGTAGVYRGPSSLPNGDILASYAANVQDPATGVPKYDLVAVNPTPGAASLRRTLLSDPSRSFVDAALGAKRSSRELFRNLPQLVFGGHSAAGGDYGVMHFPDVPMLATLLGANLRRGRNVERFDTAVGLKVYEELPPPNASPGGLQGSQNVYVDRVALGSVRFESDHSLKVAVPARKPLILELIDSGGNPVFTMTEEHQVSAGEYVTPGVPRKLFNAICGGCHGSLSGSELDIAVTPDALTGASVSRSRAADPRMLE